MITIESKWQEFFTSTYPGMDEKSEQGRQLKACFHAAWMDCMIVLKHDIGRVGAKDPNAAIEMLKNLNDEATIFVAKYIDEEMQRQGISP